MDHSSPSGWVEANQLAAASKDLYRVVSALEVGKFALVVSNTLKIENVFSLYVERPIADLLPRFLKTLKPDQFSLISNTDFGVRINPLIRREWGEKVIAIDDQDKRDTAICNVVELLFQQAEKQVNGTIWSKIISDAASLSSHIKNSAAYDDTISSLSVAFLKRSLLERNYETSSSYADKAFELVKTISNETQRNHTLLETIRLLTTESKTKVAEGYLLSHGVGLIDLISKVFHRDAAFEKCARALAQKSFFEPNPADQMELRKRAVQFADRIEKGIVKQQFYNYFFNHLIQEYGFDQAIEAAEWISEKTTRTSVQSGINRARIEFASTSR